MYQFLQRYNVKLDHKHAPNTEHITALGEKKESKRKTGIAKGRTKVGYGIVVGVSRFELTALGSTVYNTLSLFTIAHKIHMYIYMAT